MGQLNIQLGKISYIIFFFEFKGDDDNEEDPLTEFNEDDVALLAPEVDEDVASDEGGNSTTA